MGLGVVLTDKQRLFGNNPGKFFAGTPFALTTIRSRKNMRSMKRGDKHGNNITDHPNTFARRRVTDVAV